MRHQQSIQTLQMVVTNLSNGAFVHLVQGKHFEAMGLPKLGERYREHYAEEMEWVEKCITRINDLGGEVKIEAQQGKALITDPVDYIQADLDIQQRGVNLLYDVLAELKDDPTTYDILKAYLADEEEDLYWSQGQLELIALIGRENWLTKQI